MPVYVVVLEHEGQNGDTPNDMSIRKPNKLANTTLRRATPTLYHDFETGIHRFHVNQGTRRRQSEATVTVDHKARFCDRTFLCGVHDVLQTSHRGLNYALEYHVRRATVRFGIE